MCQRDVPFVMFRSMMPLEICNKCMEIEKFYGIIILCQQNYYTMIVPNHGIDVHSDVFCFGIRLLYHKKL